MKGQQKSRKSYSRPVKEKLVLTEDDELNTSQQRHALTKRDNCHPAIYEENPRHV